MASIAEAKARIPYARPLAADTFEKALAAGAVVLLISIAAAVLKGRAQWGGVPPLVWPHLLTITVAVGLTPVMLLRARGTRGHRQLGWVWVTAMFLTAVSSLFVRNANHGGFSFIHILSVWTLIQVPIIVWSARNHRVHAHRSSVRGMVTGALLVAGFFTFPFNRMLGQWLFS